MSQLEATRYLPVTIDGTEVLVDAARVVGTEDGAHAQRNPTARPPWGWLLGATDGVEVFTLDPRPRSSHKADPDTASVLILERKVGERWGLLVDRVGLPIEIAQNTILPIPRGTIRTPYAAVARVSGRERLILDTDRLHPADAQTQPLATSEIEPPRLAMPALGTARSPRMVWLPVAREPRITIGLSVRQVVEAGPRLALIPAQNLGTPIRGFVIYQETPIPVADYRSLFGLTDSPSVDPPNRERPVLVARGTRSIGRVALPMAEEPRTVDLPIESQARPLKGRRNRWLRGAYDVDGGLLIIPDLDAVASDSRQTEKP